MVNMSTKRKNRDFDEKLAILEAVDKKVDRKEICKQFGLAKSSLSKIEKDRENIYDALASGNFSTKTKRLRTAKYGIPNLRNQLFEKWKRRSEQFKIILPVTMFLNHS